MTREIYDECHGHDYDIPDDGEPRCTICGRDLFGEERVFDVSDEDGHSIFCMHCLKKMSIADLADLFGVELKKVRNL